MYREYRDRHGWAAIPLKEDGSKRPAVPWKQFQVRLPTDEEVSQWENNSGTLLPDPQVAVITGAISGLVVLDVDSELGWDFLKDFTLPPTVQAWTTEPHPHMEHHPRGKAHFYFRHPGPEWVIPNRVRVKALGGGCDVRGDGGYVVAPPSRHGPDKSRPSLSTGWDYEWAAGRAPQEAEVHELPKWLWDRIGVHRQGETDPLAKVATVEISDEDMLPAEEPHWLATALRGVPEGERDDTAARLAGYFLGARLPQDHVEAIMEAWNVRNSPPLPRRDIAKVVKSVARKEATKAEVQATAAVAAALQPDDPRDALTGINEVLHLDGGLRIVEIFKFLGDQPDVVLRFADGSRMQLKPAQLMRQSSFQEACVAQINYVPPDIATKKNPRAWKLVVQAILDAALLVEAAFESTKKGELTTALEAYLADNPPSTIGEPHDLPEEPFIYQKNLHISSILLHQYMYTRLFSRWTIQDVARFLKELRWKQVRPRWGAARIVCWQAPPDFVFVGAPESPPAKIIPLRSAEEQI